MSAIFRDTTIVVMFIENVHPRLNPLCPWAIDFKFMIISVIYFYILPLSARERKAQKEGARWGSRTG